MNLQELLSNPLFIEILKIILPASLTFAVGMYVATNTTKNSQTQLELNQAQLEIDANEAFRKDLIGRVDASDTRIDKLGQEVMLLREKNAAIQEKNLELRELLAVEKERVIQFQYEKDHLLKEIELLQQDRVRHANRIIVMEDEIRTLRTQVDKLKKENPST